MHVSPDDLALLPDSFSIIYRQHAATAAMKKRIAAAKSYLSIAKQGKNPGKPRSVF